MSNDTLTLREAAQSLGVHPTTLHAAIKRGSLPASKKETVRGPVWLVTREAVEQYRAQSLGRPGRKE